MGSLRGKNLPETAFQYYSYNINKKLIVSFIDISFTSSLFAFL
jgi:hypothetical protein